MTDELDVTDEATEDLLIQTFRAMADGIQSNEGWAALVADVEAGAQREQRSFIRPFMVAAAVLVAAFATYRFAADASTQSLDTTGPIQSYVLAGETVLSQDPLVVSAAVGAEPTFDTSKLGRRLVFEPLDPADPVVSILMDREDAGPLAYSDVTKVTLLGWVEGEAWLLKVTDGPNTERIGGVDSDVNFRMRSLVSTTGGGGTGKAVPIESLEMIEQLSSEEHTSPYGAGYGAPIGWVEWHDVPSDAVVVTFADADQKMWITPSAGVAVFPAWFDEGERFELNALNEQGEVIASTSETVWYKAGTWKHDPQAGDDMGVIRGTDTAGDPIAIEQDGRSKVLVYGAEWCVPCSEVIDSAVPVLAELEETVDVYSVPHYVEEGGLWPVSTDWPFTILQPESPSEIQAVGYLPAVLVLDGNNRVLGLIDGFENLASELEALGIGHK